MEHTSVTVLLWLGMGSAYTLQASVSAHYLQMGSVTRKQHVASRSLHRLRGAQAPAKECTHHGLSPKARRILSTKLMDNEQATQTPTWQHGDLGSAYMEKHVRSQANMERTPNEGRQLRAPRPALPFATYLQTERLPISGGSLGCSNTAYATRLCSKRARAVRTRYNPTATIAQRKPAFLHTTCKWDL